MNNFSHLTTEDDQDDHESQQDLIRSAMVIAVVAAIACSYYETYISKAVYNINPKFGNIYTDEILQSENIAKFKRSYLLISLLGGSLKPACQSQASLN